MSQLTTGHVRVSHSGVARVLHQAQTSRQEFACHGLTRFAHPLAASPIPIADLLLLSLVRCARRFVTKWLAAVELAGPENCTIIWAILTSPALESGVASLRNDMSSLFS